MQKYKKTFNKKIYMFFILILFFGTDFDIIKTILMFNLSFHGY